MMIRASFQRAANARKLGRVSSGGEWSPQTLVRGDMLPVRSTCSVRWMSQQSFSDPPPTTATEPKKNAGILERLFGVESNYAAESFKARWTMLIPAFITHHCVGSPYAWSVMADIITRENGFVAPAAEDWTLLESALPLSVIFLVHGVASSLLGKWQLKVGPRKCMALASVAFGGGLLLGSLGIYLHSLPLMYFGYGGLAGLGIGLSYTPPVQALIQWFPEKKGIASGIAISGFGSGALGFTPCVQYLTKKFAKMPEFLGPAENFVTQTIDGKLFAEVNGALVEVVKAGATELSKLPFDLAEGLYVVGSGSTGSVEALSIMGATYFALMAASSLVMKRPHPSFVPPGLAAAPGSTAATKVLGPDRDATVDEVMRTPQFYLLGTTFFCLACGGMGIFSVAKPMMSEVFSAALPAIVTASFSAHYVLMMSCGNLGGRLGWAALSDVIGRRLTFKIVTLGSIPLYLSLPYLVNSVVTTGSAVPLYMFCGCTALAVSGMGASFAVLPAYEADLFGSKNMAAIHGRLLIFSSSAALLGPMLFLKLRSYAEQNAITDLLTKISPEKFHAAFGAPMEKASELLAAKTISISKLLVLAPPGTLDPTPHLYDTTMYTLSAMMTTAFVSHWLVKPYFPPKDAIEATAKEVPAGEQKASSPPSSPGGSAKLKEEQIGDREVKKQ